jgi:hypothetical protein
MRIKLQLVICSDDGQEETVTDVVTLKKDHRHLEHLGLTLTEAKQLLKIIQHRVLQHQVHAFLDACSICPDYSAPLKAKGYHTRSFCTLFGTSNCRVRVSIIVVANVERPRCFALYPLFSPSRFPQSQLFPTGRPEVLDPGEPCSPQPHPSCSACPDRAWPCHALPRAAAACCRRRRRRARGERVLPG